MRCVSKRSLLASSLVGGFVIAACGGAPPNGFDLDAGGTFGVGSDGSPITQPTGSGSGGLPGQSLGSGSGTGTTTAGPDGGPCTYMDSTDHDGDGWSFAEGDCNDCNKFINPGAYDVPMNGIDEDCDGTADNEPTGCDSALTSISTTTGADGAKAMDLCRTTTTAPATPKQRTWGVLEAAYVLPDGSSGQAGNSGYELGYGILGPSFGTSNHTQEGVRMLGLSSGTARQPTDPGYQDVSGFDKGYTSGAPTGFPGQTPACGNVTFGAPHDGAGLRVVIRVPTNALTMSFDTNFFSYEFPDWVCSEYNDTFVVIMTPSPPGEPSTANDNIAFDSKGNVISINAGFLQVCDPTSSAGAAGTGPMAGGYVYACPEGASKLHGTGFGIDTTSVSPLGDGQDHASTDWLTTTVNVSTFAGKQITLLFAVWDSSDGQLDTTVLVDNVKWTFATGPNTQPPPVMTPITQPK
jgi:hypothetical protein